MDLSRRAIWGIIASSTSLSAHGQSCAPQWLKGTGEPGVTGSNGVSVMAPFDPDGAGPAPPILVAGGHPGSIGGVVYDFAAAWNGQSWRSTGAGPGFQPLALTTFVDPAAGVAPALIAAGYNGEVGPVVAQWDGVNSWTALDPLSNEKYADVTSVVTYDPDGSGSAPARLVVGGTFNSINGVPAANIAAWMNGQWSALGDGLEGFVNALASWDPDGDGPQHALLIAAVNLDTGGSQSARLAAWDGAKWTSLVPEIAYYSVRSLVSFDADADCPGLPRLIAAGYFTSIGGVPASGIAAWNGTDWRPLGTRVNDGVSALTTFDPDGSGPEGTHLLASEYVFNGGNPYSRILDWDGAQWRSLVDTINNDVWCIAALNPGGGAPPGDQVVIGGSFSRVGETIAAGVARWDGTAWRAMAGGTDSIVTCSTVIDPSYTMPEAGQLVVGGYFDVIEGVPAKRVAVSSGNTWSPLGNDATFPPYAIAAFDPDGAGPQPGVIVAAGLYPAPGANPVAWNGSAWEVLGSGINNGIVQALTTFDPDAEGPAPVQLIAAGQFTSVLPGGGFAHSVAAWNGTVWSALWPGLSSQFGTASVRALATCDVDGEGPSPPRLFAAGQFNSSVSDGFASRIAQWDGASWTRLGAGLNNTVTCLVTFDPDGPGPQSTRLIAAGNFTTAGGIPASRIAQWNGTQWSALSTGLGGNVSALATFDPDGNGPSPNVLVASGFAQGGHFLAVWNGSAWSPLSSDASVPDGTITTLTSYDPDQAPGTAAARLIVGGYFLNVGDQPSAYLARWGRDDSLWGAAASGSLDNPMNWVCGREPSAFDTVTVDGSLAGYPTSAFTIALPPSDGVVSARALTVRTDDVTLDLNGSSLTLSGDTAGIDSPGLQVGGAVGPSCSLTIVNSGGYQTPVLTSALNIGEAPNSSAGQQSLTFSGQTASLVSSGDAVIGRRAPEGRLTIEQGADALIYGSTSVGAESGSYGRLQVRGAGSTLQYGQAGCSLVIGAKGAASFLVGGPDPGDHGASANSMAPLSNVALGAGYGGHGEAMVSGKGSIWISYSDNYDIGYSGSGTLRVEGGGTLATHTANEPALGKTPGSSGLAVVTGAGSTWTEHSSPVRIGTSGVVQVNDDGTLIVRSLEIDPGGLLAGNSTVATTIGGGYVRNVGAVAPSSGTEDASGVGTLSILGDFIMCDVLCSPPGACCTLSGCADTTGAACFAQGGIFYPERGCASCPCASPGGLTHPQTGALLIDIESPSSRDQLVVSDGATLAGTLVVSNLTPSYVPDIGETLPFLTASTLSGAFGVSLMPPLPGGRFLVPVYWSSLRSAGAGLYCSSLATDIQLDPTGDTSVPGVPTGAAVADFDGDGDIDLAIAVPDPANPGTAPGTVVILRNAGNTGPGGSWGGFTQAPSVVVTVGVDPRGIVAARLNADDAPDLAVTNHADGTVKVLTNAANGTAQMSVTQTVTVGAGPIAVTAGDFRATGVRDLGVANQLSSTVTVLQNNGAGTFAPGATLQTGQGPTDIRAANFDSNAFPDLVTADRDAGTISVFVRDNAGYVSTPNRTLYAGNQPSTIEPGTLDNGKDEDIVVTNTGGDSLSFFIGTGTGQFAPGVHLPVGLSPSSITSADFDADGDPDLAVVTSGAGNQRVIRVFRNDRTATQLAFTPVIDEFSGANPVLARTGDLDANGRTDLIAVTSTTLLASERGGAQPAITAALSRPPCPADLSGDGVVGTADLVLLLAVFGQAVPPGTPADLNDDGVVNTSDLVLMLVRFGLACS